MKTVRVINFVFICKISHYFVTEACKEGDAVLAALAAILVFFPANYNLETTNLEI